MKIKRRKLILIFFYTVALQIFIFTILHLSPTTAQSSFIAHLPSGYTAYSGKLEMGQACSCATGVLTGAPPSSLPPCGTFCYGSSSNTRYGWLSTTARGINSTFCKSSPCFQLDGDDAIVIQGSMSPIQNLTYYSFTFYQSFTTTNQPSNRYTATQGSINLGLNNASLKIGSDGRYVVIVTANTNTLQVLESSLQRAGISHQIINNYLVPASLTNAGTSTYPDQLSLLLRLTAQSEIEKQKVNNFIQQTVPATTVSFIKGPGINGNVTFEDLPKWENTLRVNQAEYTAKLDRSLAVLERSVVNFYRQKGYRLKTRQTENLLHIDANLCRSLPINCQYDSPDAIYTGFPSDYTNPVKPGFFKIKLAPNSDDVLNTVSFDGVGSSFSVLCRTRCSSGVYSRVEIGAMGNGGDINITTGSLSVTNGARLGTSTLGRGDAGNVNIHARNTVSIDGVGRNGYSSGIGSTVASGAVGSGRSVNISAGLLSVTNGAVVGASTSGEGNGGNITLNINTLEILNGGQVLTTGFSGYKAGNITVNATDNITLSGSDSDYSTRLNKFGRTIVLNAGSASGLFANTDEQSSGQGGNVTINTPTLMVRDGAQVSVSSQGSGKAGNIEVEASSIRLDNQASIRAETASLRSNFNQANITLNSEDLVLRHGSKITTDAEGSANGGNITIDTGVLVALENSDITANSTDSRGGNVNITAQGIFGTKFRDAFTSTSDITATGKDSSLSGTVTINTPGVDPSRGLVTLPTTVIEHSDLIAQNPCERGKSSSFVVTGRGGLPPNPSDALTSDATHVGLVEPASMSDNSSSATLKEPPTRPTANRVVPAVGWVFNNKGEVVLTAYNPINTESQRPRVNAGACHEP